MINISKYKFVFLGIAFVLVVASLAGIAMYGFRPGVDFTGGTMWQFSVRQNTPAADELEGFIKSQPVFADTPDVKVATDPTTGDFLARFPEIGEAAHQKLLTAAKEKYSAFSEMSFQSIGPSVSAELRNNAYIAIVLVLIGISLYIAFAFRKISRPVSSWMYGFMTLISLFHDVVIPAGLMAYLGHYLKVEIDTNFIVALLVVMGFSVHDTIVVFDRTRENLFADRSKSSFSEIVNKSVNQTLARSINTSLTLILVLLVLYFVGPAHLQWFILTLLVGVTTGIYSSVFVASPALLLVGGKK